MFSALADACCRIGVLPEPAASSGDITALVLDLSLSGRDMQALLETSGVRGGPAFPSPDSVSAQDGAAAPIDNTVSLEHFLLWARTNDVMDRLLRQFDDLRVVLRAMLASGGATTPQPAPLSVDFSDTTTPPPPALTQQQPSHTASLWSPIRPSGSSPKKRPTTSSSSTSTFGQRQQRLQRSLLERIATDQELVLLSRSLRFSVPELKSLRYGCAGDVVLSTCAVYPFAGPLLVLLLAHCRRALSFTALSRAPIG